MGTNSNPPLHFNCHLCGDCCSSWNIPIERKKAEILLTKPWVQTRLKEARRSLIPISNDTYRLPLTDENMCIFLGTDRKCLVEVYEGADLKPTDCKRFPFASVKLPDGTTQHDTSAVCKHISEKLLLAFQPILPKPDETESLNKLFEQDGLEDLPQQIHLNLFQKISWQELLDRWEKPLKDIFNTPHISTEQALQQARTLITSRKNKRHSVKLRFSKWITLCFLRKPYGTLSAFSLLRGKRYTDPRIFGLPVDLQASQRLTWNPVFDHQVNAFLYNLLTRKRPLARGGSLESLLAMGTVAALLIRWYVITLASIRLDETEAPVNTTHDDVTLGIRLVERYYTGHQPRFIKLFCHRWRAALLLWLML